MILEVAKEKAEQHHREQLWLAWHTALFGRMKRLPSFKSLIGDDGTRVLEGEELEEQHRERDEMLAGLDIAKINRQKRK